MTPQAALPREFYSVKKSGSARRWLRRSSRNEAAHRTSIPSAALDLERSETRVRAVLAEQALETLLQPIMDLKSGRPVGVEALSRIHQQPLRPPDAWFNEAAAVGLGVELEMLAITKALDTLWRLPSGVYLAINASADTIISEQFRQVVGTADTDRLVLEITEHTKVGDYGRVRDTVQELRGRGLRLAVDDAGAGYASFRHVLNLQPDIIKLDIDLTRGIDRDPARQALGSALLTFGLDAYNASMVAEGIETASELDTLRSMGCPLGQGFYLGRPGRLRLPAPGGTAPGRLWTPRSGDLLLGLEVPDRAAAPTRPPEPDRDAWAMG